MAFDLEMFYRADYNELCNAYVPPKLSEEYESNVKIATEIIKKLSGGKNGLFSSTEQTKYYEKLIKNGTVTVDGNTAKYCGVSFIEPSFTREDSILASNFITSLLGQIDSEMMRRLRKSTEPECNVINKKFNENSIAYRICLIELYKAFVLKE